VQPGYTGCRESFLDALQIVSGRKGEFIEGLPFSAGDTTAGSENELQTVVIGRKDDVDLPVTIQESNYYKNIIKRMVAGETPKKIISDLERFLGGSQSAVWENSWVRLPLRTLNAYARHVFESDLRADKSQSVGALRGDINRYCIQARGDEYIRIPVSYLLKLSLTDAIGSSTGVHRLVRSAGKRLMSHFLNDNTSPETFSFHPALFTAENNMGMGIARETAKRYLLTQLVVMYANRRFDLIATGQKAMVYFSPHPPVHLKQLNEIISDSFYRELFMNPCLSGWDRGEEKYRYMHLCHEVLSRSQLNAVVKLREAGIIANNLVVLPNTSNISLANNGTHISMGSLRLKALLKDPSSGFRAQDEKYFGDLAIKIVEHFLPLFVGTYSASPYRLDFTEFHPEKALGFLPHELDYTHLRMIWRRWKKKADLKIMGQPITPFGPKLLDETLSRVFHLKGDFVQDFRLIDYLVCLMSTPESPALNGTMGNEQMLRNDLANLGVFDRNMSLYLFFKLRNYSTMGFSGFEGRYYSLFRSITGDMSQAANLQNLLTALAYKYILSGEVTHEHIPDDPGAESERRQIFFGTAIGIPTFFIRKSTKNRFLLRIINKTGKTRVSRRYPGYLRVYNMEYRRALLEIIREDAPDLIGALGMKGTVMDLEERLEPRNGISAASRITQGIMQGSRAKSPIKLSGDEFNGAAEEYYRNTLRREHIREGLEILKQDCRKLDAAGCEYAAVLRSIFGDTCSAEFVDAVENEVLEENTSADVLRKLVHLMLVTIHKDIEQYKRLTGEG
ncbi:MAG: hypothetical protein JXM72_04830, partial [Deltaproteobacteria bacterium]|nr:hypothetical protein [Deltaproteobacteria bacterium]